MRKLEYSFTSFAGINQADPASSGQVTQANNVDQVADYDSSSTKYYGFIKKVPNVAQLGNTLTGLTSRGLYLFVPTDVDSAGFRYIQAFSDGTVRYLDPITNTWITIFTEPVLSGALQYDFESYRTVLYFTNGFNPIQKWRIGWAASKNLADLGGTPGALIGYAFTFTIGSPDVTCTTDVTAHLAAGDWIQAGADLPWYEVKDITFLTPTTYITLRDAFGETTISPATTYKAPDSTLRSRFLTVFKDRMYYAAGDLADVPIVEVAEVYDDGVYTYPQRDPNSPFVV